MTDRNFTTYYDQDQADRLAEWQLANPRPPGDLDRIRDAIGQVPEGFDPRDPNRPRNPNWVDPDPGRLFAMSEQDSGGGSFIDQARLLVPWMPEALLQTWMEAYAEYGNDPLLATAEVRRHKDYDSYFPGNRRPDGSVRNDEGTYTSTFEGYARVVLEAGLNPDLFASQMVGLYEGDTSVAEFQGRVSAVKTRIFDNIAEVRATFGEFYGIGDLGDEAFLAAALDPSVGNDIMSRQIDVSTVAASGRQAGFQIGKDFATRLVDRGYDQQTAQQNLYDPARSLVPSLNRSARRFGVDKDVDFNEFADATAFKDPYQQQRMRRLQSQERSLFTGSSVKRDESGLTGLKER